MRKGALSCFPYAAAQPLGMSNPFYSGCYRSWEVYLGRGFGIYLSLSPGLSSSSSSTRISLCPLGNSYPGTSWGGALTPLKNPRTWSLFSQKYVTNSYR